MVDPKTRPALRRVPHQRLPDMLKAARDGGAHLVIINSPPKIGAAITASLRIADRVLIPLQPGTFEIQALEDTVGLMNLAESPRKGHHHSQ